MLRPWKPTPAVSTSFYLLNLSLTLESCQELAAVPTTLDLSSLIPLQSSQGAADPDDGVAVEVSGSTGDHDGDSTGDVSSGEANKGIEKSNSDSESQSSPTDSSQESVSGDCLICSDTEEAVVKIAQKKICKKVWISCRPSRWGPWKVPQMAQIGKSQEAVWGSDFRIVQTE